MSAQDNIKKLGDVFHENLPHILTGVASVGVVATAIETGKAVLKIKELDETEDDNRKHRIKQSPLSGLSFRQ